MPTADVAVLAVYWALRRGVVSLQCPAISCLIYIPSRRPNATAMPGENLDLSSDVPHPVEPALAAGDTRPFLGIRFACCDVYARVYLNRDGTAYQGACPRCLIKRVSILVGPGGTSDRFFTVY